MKEAEILVLDPDPVSGFGKSVLKKLEAALNHSSCIRFRSLEVSESVIGGGRLLTMLSRLSPDVLILAVPPGYMKKAAAFVQSIEREPFTGAVLVLFSGGRPSETVDLCGQGAADWITAPFDTVQILDRLRHSLERLGGRDELVQTLKEGITLRELIGESDSFTREMGKVLVVAKRDTRVLVSGERGTGKRTCARAIHYLSLRADRPFIPVDCRTMNRGSKEDELFGHEELSVGGAVECGEGVIRKAGGATVFLDKIDCLSVAAQAKLLRAVLDEEYRRFGSEERRRKGVRIIAAAGNRLEEAVAEGKFRQDLFSRINVFPITLPSLRERRGDIPLLAHHFLEKYSIEFGRDVRSLSPHALQKLESYGWPGNVRELEKVLERAVILSTDSVIHREEILLPQGRDEPPLESFKKAKSLVIAQFERNYVRKLLREHQGNISKAARAAHKNRRAFWELIRKYKIDVQSFTSPPQ
ncbi:MAG: sigma-54 dependent transcriptional regulator [Nitrospirae bacterium]|nr:sigma-54 dependent transcriptional regulator [Nitrospirota bacterium]